MILLFGNKANRSSASNKSSQVKSNPVENSGILAMSQSEAKSLLTVGEYDTYMSSNPTAVDYAMYANYDFADGSESSGFMSDFSAAVAVLGDCGFSAGGFDCGGATCSSGSSCGSFASFC